jgi:hypothetical protein
MELLRQQCELHLDRGAVARCPDCGRFYCHECITEHEGEVLCKRCLNQEVESDDEPSGFMQRNAFFLKACAIPFLISAGYILLFFVFASLGMMLIRFPDEFHHAIPAALTQERVDK